MKRNHFVEEAPIEVNGVVLPTIVAVVLRYAIALLLPWLVSKGYIDEGSIEGVAAYVLVAATALYGIWKTVKRSEERTSELQSLMRISYAVFCLKKKNKNPVYA